ncbi:hypothetical protein [Kitasatospora sp. NPDC091207]|uniref:hypothetical protein n=1 Tax=Kitasatospora sp. NPDC091207 TaxID=3364083 RepID=UPI00382B65B3
MTSHLPRGLTALIPTARTTATPGERAAAQMLHLREATNTGLAPPRMNDGAPGL